MGLRPTEGDEKRLVLATTLYGIVTLSLSSRPERSGAEGPAVPRTLRGDVFRQSVAEWRDLRFLLSASATLNFIHVSVPDPNSRSLCRNRPDGRGLLRQLLHLV